MFTAPGRLSYALHRLGRPILTITAVSQKFVVENLDGVEESAKSLYMERNGKFYLDVDGAVDKSEIDGLTNNRDKILKEKKALEEKIKAHEAEITKAKEEAAKEAEEKLKKMGDIEGLTKSYEAKLAEATKSKVTELEQVFAEIKRLTVDRTAMELAAKHAIDENAVSVLAELVSKDFQVRYENGKSSVVVVDKSGNATAYTVGEYEKQMLADPRLQRLLKGTGASGGGAVGGNGNGGGATKKGARGCEHYYKIIKMRSIHNGITL